MYKRWREQAELARAGGQDGGHMNVRCSAARAGGNGRGRAFGGDCLTHGRGFGLDVRMAVKAQLCEGAAGPRMVRRDVRGSADAVRGAWSVGAWRGQCERRGGRRRGEGRARRARARAERRRKRGRKRHRGRPRAWARTAMIGAGKQQA
jgi:hypothetical protein